MLKDDYLKVMQQIYKIHENRAIKEAQQSVLKIQGNLVEIHIETLASMRKLENVLDTNGISDGSTIGKQLQSALNSLPKVDTSMLRHVSRTLLYAEGLSILNVNASDKNDVAENDTEEESNRANAQIIKEIFKDDDSKIITQNSPIIHISPINDAVLKYLSENPKCFYELSGSDFEEVMAEIYRRLGYNVEKTKKTRDGGKDIIIRKPEILGDFVYYVNVSVMLKIERLVSAL